MIGRVQQGLRALTTWSRPVDERLAAEFLTPPLLDLFRQMRRAERQHSLDVLRMLRAQGESHPALLVAALLHDVGKSRAPFWLWERVVVVIAKAVAPRRASRWGDGLPNGWRRPFVIGKQHPAWSAEMAAAAGADPLSVELIAHHQRKRVYSDDVMLTEPERLLQALQAADDTN